MYVSSLFLHIFKAFKSAFSAMQNEKSQKNPKKIIAQGYVAPKLPLAAMSVAKGGTPDLPKAGCAHKF